MNLKLKTLIAATIASMAISGAANATMADTGLTNANGDSSLILTLLDRTDGISATFDLGFTDHTFDQTTSQSWSLTGANYGTAFADFFTTATAANTVFAVFAGDSTGTAIGDTNLFTTVATTWTNVSGSGLNTLLRNFDTYINANNPLGTNATFADGASTATAASGGSAYAGVVPAYGATGKIDTLGGVTTVAFGSNANVFNIVRASTNNLTNTAATQLNVSGFNPYFSVNPNGTLNYVAAAPVPEADTWAMLVAGLGLMGFIARRRTASEVV